MTSDTDVHVAAADRSPRFRQRDGVRLYEMAGEAVVYDPAQHSIHYLNATALAIWQRCDGRRDASDLAEELLPLFEGGDAPPNTQRLADDVRDTLDALARNGLLDDTETAGA